MFQKEAIFCYLDIPRCFWYDNLDIPRCFWYVKSHLFSFRVYMIQVDEALTYRDPILPAWRDGYANAYVPI